MNEENTNTSESKVKMIFSLVLKVIPLAMGVAVVALTTLNQFNITAVISMLGIGMFCLAIERLIQK